MMQAPDCHFMVHSHEFTDKAGSVFRGTKVTAIEESELPPEWILRDFGFSCFSDESAAPGLRLIHFGKREVYAFASAREHCEEIAVFRRGDDTKKKWDTEQLKEAKVGLDMFFVMRMKQIGEATPLNKCFNGEWGFWESFYVPILDEEQSIQLLSEMDASAREKYFALQKLPVTCHKCPEGRQVLTIPDDMTVKYRVRVPVRDVEAWSDICNKIGEDMILQFPLETENRIVASGSELIEASSEMDGKRERAQLKKYDFERLKLPVDLIFECDMNVAAEWRPDVPALVRKYDQLGEDYVNNLQGGWSYACRMRPDPWAPMARLAISALNKILSRHPEITSIMDVGCGDMAWMQYVLQDHPEITYVGVDIQPYTMMVNFRRFPKMQFIQTDLSNMRGIEIMPRGCDLVLAKDIFNHMVLPDAVDAVRRVINTRPKFMLTHIHNDSDNTGWEARIDQHRAYTPYNYNRQPFSLPYPCTEVQRISDEAAYVLYQITPDLVEGGAQEPPPRVENLAIAPKSLSRQELDAFITVQDGEWTEPQATIVFPEMRPEKKAGEVRLGTADDLGPKPAPMEGPEEVEGPEEGPAMPERKPIKGIPAVEFRARCDKIFDKYDRDLDKSLNFEELQALMDAGGRKIEQYEAYAGLCQRLGCDARIGLSRKDVYKLFEKAPQSVWEEVYRQINPVAEMVKKGADKLPATFLERPMPNYIFDDDEMTAKIQIEINAHLYFGAADVVTEDHVQAFFGKQRLEVHIVAPGSYGAKDLYKWKLVITPLTAEIVPEDCSIEFKASGGSIIMKATKVTIKLVKSKKKKWPKVGMAATGATV
mmetsp:Transcript_50807/g.104504  ORF Transcript_50807/g.104504 Transcript_50807/m.104504 type:complete len:821 (+) Transcript_50807:160-2622(+)